MAKPTVRTTTCTAAMRAGRLSKAQQFFDAADMLDALVDDESELIEASITLCVHAGIAAADVICGRYQGPKQTRPGQTAS